MLREMLAWSTMRTSTTAGGGVSTCGKAPIQRSGPSPMGTTPTETTAR